MSNKSGSAFNGCMWPIGLAYVFCVFIVALIPVHFFVTFILWCLITLIYAALVYGGE